LNEVHVKTVRVDARGHEVWIEEHLTRIWPAERCGLHRLQ
jgi:hypothetical protein